MKNAKPVKIKTKDFDLAQTLECGQCFNFEKIGSEEYIVSAKGRMLHARQEGNELLFLNASEDDINKIWITYFDLERDYANIKNEIVKADPRLEPIIEANSGIRILNQDFTETLISFIISQNKNIPHIKQIVRNISERHGEIAGKVQLDVYDIARGDESKTDENPCKKTDNQGFGINVNIDINSCGPEIKKAIENGETERIYYKFPKIPALAKFTEEDFKELKTGFRAHYLCDAISKMADGSINEDELKSMNFAAAKERLMTIKGVGDKVANCVLLFGLGFRNAFPVDVWIKRIMEEMYFGKPTDKKVIEQFAAEKFGEYGGYAQQYLFIYAKQ